MTWIFQKKSILFISVILATMLSFTKSCLNCNKVIGKVVSYGSSSKLSVSLEGANRASYLNEDGIFVFYNVEPGSYLLNVNDNNYHYEQILVEVNQSEVKAFQYNLKTGKGLKYQTIEFRPAFKIQYEEESPNLVGNIIKSPYFILIGVTVLMFLCMQAIPQDQMKEQMKEMNSQMGSFSKMFQQ